MRYCPAGLPHFRDEADFINFNVAVECEQPCEDLYSFNGNLLIPQYAHSNITGRNPSLATVPEDTLRPDSLGKPHNSESSAKIGQIKSTEVISIFKRQILQKGSILKFQRCV
jgi:hypothetical protein